MSLITGTPLGNVDSQESLIVQGAPYVYFQDWNANELKNPDSDGYYWGLSGTTTYPVYEIGCASDVSFTEDITINNVRCDGTGDKNAVQKRNFMDLNITLTHLFPFANTYHLLKAGLATVNSSEGTEKIGFGPINNNRYYHVYLPAVYDDDTGDYIVLQLHKAQLVDAMTITMTSGDAWKLTGLKLRAFWDDRMPSAQAFVTAVRVDPSVI